MWPRLSTKTLLGHAIYNFGKPFHGLHYNILCLSDLGLEVEKKISKKKKKKEIMHVDYMANMARPQHKNSCSRGHEIYNFGRPFHGHLYYTLGLTDLGL